MTAGALDMVGGGARSAGCRQYGSVGHVPMTASMAAREDRNGSFMRSSILHVSAEMPASLDQLRHGFNVRFQGNFQVLPIVARQPLRLLPTNHQHAIRV